jgi:hypothetical protein
MKDFCVDLKVCEGCGALWLRSQSNGVYCRGCAQQIAEYPAVRKSRGGRKRKTATRLVVCTGGAR